MINRRSLIKVTAAAGATGGLVALGVSSTSATPLAGQAATGGHGGPGGRPRETLAVIEKGSHALAFFDPATGERKTTIQLPDYPHEMVVDSEHRYAYIGHYGVRMGSDPGEGGSAVIIVDLHRREIARIIDTQPYNRIHGMAIDRHDRVYALSEADAVLMVFDRPRTDQAPTRVVPIGGEKTHMLSLTRDGERAYVTGLNSNTVSMVRPHDRHCRPEVLEVGTMPEGCNLSPNERVLYVGARGDNAVVAVDTRTMRVRKTAQVEGDPLRVYALNEHELLVSDIENNTVSMLDSRNLRKHWSIPFEGAPASLSLHPSKPMAFVSQFETNRLAVVDLEKRAIVNEFDTQVEPDGTALLPY